MQAGGLITPLICGITHRTYQELWCPLPLFRFRVRRQRTLPSLVQKTCGVELTYRYYTGGVPPTPVRSYIQPSAPGKRMGDQVTDSEEHPQWSRAQKRRRRRKPVDLEDIGGDFWTQKHYALGSPTHISVKCAGTDIGQNRELIKIVRGPAWSIDVRSYPYPPSLSSTDAQLDALGATAIAKCKPTRSNADVGVALGELIREGIPKIVVAGWHSRARNLQTGKHVQPEHVVSDNYLAYQFGLKPLGQEIGTFAAEVIRADQLLTQYEKDAGQVVRRRFTFPPKHEITLSTAYGPSEPYIGSPQSGISNQSLTPTQLGELQVVREVTQKRWFSGAFTYYLPYWYDARSEMSRKALLAKEILGVDLDLEVIWNLTPWSWAVDWFSNAGDVISNVNSMVEDGLIMRYGYMMEHTIVKDTYTRKYKNQFYNGQGTLDSFVTLVTETKIRRRANPFGFGLTWNGLSSFQKSIIAALGISKGR